MSDLVPLRSQASSLGVFAEEAYPSRLSQQEIHGRSEINIHGKSGSVALPRTKVVLASAAAGRATRDRRAPRRTGADRRSVADMVLSCSRDVSTLIWWISERKKQELKFQWPVLRSVLAFQNPVYKAIGKRDKWPSYHVPRSCALGPSSFCHSFVMTCRFPTPAVASSWLTSAQPHILWHAEVSRVAIAHYCYRHNI